MNSNRKGSVLILFSLAGTRFYRCIDRKLCERTQSFLYCRSKKQGIILSDFDIGLYVLQFYLMM